MPILQLPPNPTSPRDPDGQPTADRSAEAQPVKVRTGRFGEMEEHELIHLLDSIDDELSKSRFRESIYISTILCLALAWFIFYGPRVLFHQPEYKDLISAMKERDKQITYLETPPTPRVPPHPPTHNTPDRKTLQQLAQRRPAAPTPQPPAPAQSETTPPPPPRTTAPPVQQPQLALPNAPRPQQQPLVDAPTPRPSVAQNSNPASAMQDAIRGARSGRGSTDYGSAPSGGSPLGAGAQILSDTMGVDFSAYLRRVVSDTKRNWEPLIPEEVQAPLLKKGIVGIRFTILPGGQVGAMTLETRSGDVALDKAAWYAITSEGNFPPLPKEFHGPQLELRFGFYYNLQPPQ